MAESPMKLFHGTAERYVPGIRKHGLWPRQTLSGNWNDLPSRHDCVYLTVSYAPYYAGCMAEKGERWAIIEVNSDMMDEISLLPDEDFLAQALTQETTLEERIGWFRDNLTDFSHYWQASVERLGNCCYQGTIPPQAIRRITLVDPKDTPNLCMMALDPVITLANFALCGSSYQNISNAFAGYPVPAESLYRTDMLTMYRELDPVSFQEQLDILTREMQMVEVCHL